MTLWSSVKGIRRWRPLWRVSVALTSTASGMEAASCRAFFVKVAPNKNGLFAGIDDIGARSDSIGNALAPGLLPLLQCPQASMANRKPLGADSTFTQCSCGDSGGNLNPSSLYPRSDGLRIITAHEAIHSQNAFCAWPFDSPFRCVSAVVRKIHRQHFRRVIAPEIQPACRVPIRRLAQGGGRAKPERRPLDTSIIHVLYAPALFFRMLDSSSATRTNCSM